MEGAEEGSTRRRFRPRSSQHRPIGPRSSRYRAQGDTESTRTNFDAQCHACDCTLLVAQMRCGLNRLKPVGAADGMGHGGFKKTCPALMNGVT
jgi:hypothetical protein